MLVEVDGRSVAVAVRVSRRARHVRITVDWKREVEVVVPLRAGPRAVERALSEHRDWLGRQLAKPPRETRLGLQRDDVVWIGGRAGPLPRAESLERWYREQARRALTAAANREATQLDVVPGPISIRDQRTRWGSCSARGALSFNWRLVLAPPEVLEYVVVHELCHRRVANHSRAFWRLMEEVRPGYEAERRWLREHGFELLAYRVPPGWGSNGPRLTATAR